MEYLVFAAGAVIFGLFITWCIVDAAADARTKAKAAAQAAAHTTSPVQVETAHAEAAHS